MIAIRTEDPVFIAALNAVYEYQRTREVGPGYSREEALDSNTGKISPPAQQEGQGEGPPK